MADHYVPGGEAGGGKAVQSVGMLFDTCQSFGNHGPGFWDDISCHGTKYVDCRTYGNTGAGFMSEISFDADYTRCVGWMNGSAGSWVGKTNFLSHTATGTKYHDCISIAASFGFGIDCQQRNSGQQFTHPVHDIALDGCIVINCPTAVAWADDWQGELYAPANNNAKGKNNLYWPGTAWFQWNKQATLSLAAYMTQTGETGSRIMTDAEKNAVLAQYGL